MIYFRGHHFWVNTLSRTDNLTPERYLRNADSVLHRSETAICQITSNVEALEKPLLKCSIWHYSWDWCFSLACCTIKQVINSNPWLPFPSSLVHFLTIEVSCYKSWTVLTFLHLNLDSHTWIHLHTDTDMKKWFNNHFAMKIIYPSGLSIGYGNFLAILYNAMIQLWIMY